jgi:hypothetical protein
MTKSKAGQDRDSVARAPVMSCSSAIRNRTKHALDPALVLSRFASPRERLVSASFELFCLVLVVCVCVSRAFPALSFALVRPTEHLGAIMLEIRVLHCATQDPHCYYDHGTNYTTNQ